MRRICVCRACFLQKYMRFQTKKYCLYEHFSRLYPVRGLIPRLKSLFYVRDPRAVTRCKSRRDQTAPTRSERSSHGKSREAHPGIRRMAGQHHLHRGVRHERQCQRNSLREDKTADYERSDNFSKTSILIRKMT